MQSAIPTSTPVKIPTKTTARNRALALHALLVYVFLYGPILVLVALSFNRSRLSTTWGGFTLSWYGVLARDEPVIRSAWYSLEISAGATLVATVVGTMAALALFRRKCPARTPTMALLYLPIIIPEIVVGCALLTFYSAVKWELSLWTVLVAHVAFSVPYVAVVVRARLAGFDRSLEEAAMDLGARPAGVFWRVKLPLILPGIIAAALLVFTVSIDDYVITSLVAGADSTTLPLRIASMVKTGLTPEVNAVSTLLLALTVVLVIIAQRLQREKRLPADMARGNA